MYCNTDLINKYQHLTNFILSQKRNDKKCEKFITNDKGPIQFLNTCIDDIFYKDGFNCKWKHSNSKIINNCTSLLSLKDIICNNLQARPTRTDYDKLLRPYMQKPKKYTHLYLGSDIGRLKSGAEKYLNNMNRLDKNDDDLQIYDGHLIIPEYIKVLLICDESTELKKFINSPKLYTLILAGECIRMLFILLYFYLFSTKSIFWDTESIEYAGILNILNCAFNKLDEIDLSKNLNHIQKKQFISLIALIKDSSIRLAMTLDLLEPLDEYDRPTTYLMENKYLYQSELYAICVFCYYHSDVDLPSDQLEFWTCQSLLKIKKTPNWLNHSLFYNFIIELNKYS